MARFINRLLKHVLHDKRLLRENLTARAAASSCLLSGTVSPNKSVSEELLAPDPIEFQEKRLFRKFTGIVCAK